MRGQASQAPAGEIAPKNPKKTARFPSNSPPKNTKKYPEFCAIRADLLASARCAPAGKFAPKNPKKMARIPRIRAKLFASARICCAV